MTPNQIAMVRASFAQVAPISRLAAELFYARLFREAPEVQHLFKGDMEAQGSKLMATLALVAQSLDNIDAILPAARDLAARHVTYGVTPAMYAPVGEALLWTLERALDEGFTPEVEEAWTTAYGILSTAMVEAAYPRAACQPGLAAE